MAPKASASKREDLKAQFRTLDASKDGKLDFTEIEELLRAGNPTLKDSEVRVLFNAMDKNRDSRISVEASEEDARFPTSNDDVRRVYRSCTAGSDYMTGMQFAQMCRECGLHDSKFTKQDADLIFNQARSKGARGVDFRQFEKLLFWIAERRGVSIGEVHTAVGDSSGHVARGTKPDPVRFHDDQSTYTGVKSQRRQVEAEGVKDGVREQGGTLPWPSPPPPPSATRRGRSPGPPGKDHEAPEMPDAAIDWNELDKVFEQFLASKDKDDFLMDSAHFAKLCDDCRLIDGSKFTKADADILFAKALGSAGGDKRRITFPMFTYLLMEVAAKKGEPGCVVHATVKSRGSSGPVLNGTKADAVRFHDDKSTYTGSRVC